MVNLVLYIYGRGSKSRELHLTI